MINFESAFKAPLNSSPDGLISLGGNRKPVRIRSAHQHCFDYEKGDGRTYRRYLRPSAALKNSMGFSLLHLFHLARVSLTLDYILRREVATHKPNPVPLLSPQSQLYNFPQLSNSSHGRSLTLCSCSVGPRTGSQMSVGTLNNPLSTDRGLSHTVENEFLN